jgi:hypothetical protein
MILRRSMSPKRCSTRFWRGADRGHLCASVAGIALHVAQSVPAHNRETNGNACEGWFVSHRGSSWPLRTIQTS